MFSDTHSYVIGVLLFVALLARRPGLRGSIMDAWVRLHAKEFVELFDLKWQTEPHQNTWHHMLVQVITVDDL